MKMTLFDKKSKQGGHAPSSPKAPIAEYYPPTVLRINDFDLNSPSLSRESGEIDLLKFDALVGASAAKTVSYKAKHLDVSVFRELNESLHVIERKFHAGMYDAQAMPLVEKFLNEVEALAQIQVERDAVNACRINDIKAANAEAYKAVYEARTERERGIEIARALATEAMLPDFDLLERKAEEESRKSLEKHEAKRAKAERRKEQSAQWKSRFAEKHSKASEAAKRRKEEKTAERQRKKAQRLEERAERDARRHKAIEQKQELKLEEHLGKKQVAQMKAQKKLEELQLAREAQKAECLVKQAQADAEIERAQALLQSARADKEAARLEEEKAKSALKAYDSLDGDAPSSADPSAEASRDEAEKASNPAPSSSEAPETSPEKVSPSPEKTEIGSEQTSTDATAAEGE